MLGCFGKQGTMSPARPGGFMLRGIKRLVLPCQGGEAVCLLFQFCFTSFFYLILEEASVMDIVQ